MEPCDVHAALAARSATKVMNRNDVGVHFGLGRTTRVKSAWKIRWPSGLVETLTDLEVDRVHVVEEGDGEPQSARVVPARAVYVR